MGESVLLGLSTDKVDYPDITSPVSVKAELYGNADANIEFFLDGTSLQSDTTILGGFKTTTFVISPSSLTSGRHSLKAILSSRGLTSTKEAGFTYGSNLPDLIARPTGEVVKGSSININTYVINKGQTASEATALALFDGDPDKGGAGIASLNVPALAPGETTTLVHAWSALGKAGDHQIYAVADPENLVAEFNETNNTGVTLVSLPSLSLALSTGGVSFRANTNMVITSSCANLSNSSAFQDLVLKVELIDPQGVTSMLKEANIATLAPSTEAVDLTNWNTGRNLPGNYTVKASLASGGEIIAANSAAFGILPTLAVTGTTTLGSSEIGQGEPLIVSFTINNNGNIDATGVVSAVLIDPQNDTIKDEKEQQADISLNSSKTDEFTFATDGLEMKTYRVDLGYHSPGESINISSASFAVKDTIPPVIAISTLSNGSYTNNEVLNIAGTATDNIGVAEVTVNGTSVQLSADGGFSHALVLQSGENTVTTVATDVAGNKTSDTRTITLDQAAPQLTVLSPSDNAKIGTSLLTITGNVDENATVTIKLGDIILNATIMGNTFTADLALIPGYNTIDITATDLAGNSGSLKRTVIYCDQAPALAVNLPGQDIITNMENLLILGSASDPYGLAVVVKVEMDGETYHPAVLNGEFGQTVTFNEEKSHAVVVTATNEVGTSTTVQRNVIYDRTPPGITLNAVVSPTDQTGQVITGTMEEGAKVSVTCSTAIGRYS